MGLDFNVEVLAGENVELRNKIKNMEEEIKYLKQEISDRTAEFELKNKVLEKKGNRDLNNNYRYGEIDHPDYYNKGNIEAIDVIEDWSLNFNLGNVIAYIARCEHKEDKLKDLKKALWYLEREIDSIK